MFLIDAREGCVPVATCHCLNMLVFEDLTNDRNNLRLVIDDNNDLVLRRRHTFTSPHAGVGNKERPTYNARHCPCYAKETVIAPQAQLHPATKPPFLSG